jgi:hypothetical protein
MPAWVSGYPQFQFAEAARDATSNRDNPPTKELKGMSLKIMELLHTVRNEPWRIEPETKTFAAALADKGIALAEVTKEEAHRRYREAEFAKTISNYASRYKEGEIVAVTAASRTEYRRNGEIVETCRVHKLDQTAARMFVGELGNGKQLQGIDATKQDIDERYQQRSQRNDLGSKIGNLGQEIPSIAEDGIEGVKSVARSATRKSASVAKENLGRVKAVSRAATRTIASLLDGACGIAESIVAPTLTPEQIRQGEIATEERRAQAERAIDYSKFTDQLAHQRQQQEQNREAARQREREGRER